MTTIAWTQTQVARLKELKAGSETMALESETTAQRNQVFQDLEKELVKKARGQLSHFLTKSLKPQIEVLKDRICDRLMKEGFARVYTPTIITKAALAKMTITPAHPLFKQVFWINDRQCLRPMLAPNLYSLMRDFGRLPQRPVRFFEMGSCFRKESDGARHSNEFTMLNLVEMGAETPDPAPEKLMERLKELAAGVADAAGIADVQFETEASDVYGATLDLVHTPSDTELASGAIGPHPLDPAWGITECWAGMGFGIERLMMAAQKDESIGRWSRSIAYQDGIRLNI